MTHLLFRRERDGILELIATAEQLISAQKEIKILCNEFDVRQRAFPTPEGNVFQHQGLEKQPDVQVIRTILKCWFQKAQIFPVWRICF